MRPCTALPPDGPALRRAAARNPGGFLPSRRLRTAAAPPLQTGIAAICLPPLQATGIALEHPCNVVRDPGGFAPTVPAPSGIGVEIRCNRFPDGAHLPQGISYAARTPHAPP